MARRVSYQRIHGVWRGALPGAEACLIGTAEHGVLGHRWIYDGTCDRVLAAQLVALIQGEAEPQAQSLSNTPDPTVTAGHRRRTQSNTRLPALLRGGRSVTA